MDHISYPLRLYRAVSLKKILTEWITPQLLGEGGGFAAGRWFWGSMPFAGSSELGIHQRRQWERCRWQWRLRVTLDFEQSILLLVILLLDWRSCGLVANIWDGFIPIFRCSELPGPGLCTSQGTLKRP